MLNANLNPPPAPALPPEEQMVESDGTNGDEGPACERCGWPLYRDHCYTTGCPGPRRECTMAQRQRIRDAVHASVLTRLARRDARREPPVGPAVTALRALHRAWDEGDQYDAAMHAPPECYALAQRGRAHTEADRLAPYGYTPTQYEAALARRTTYRWRYLHDADLRYDPDDR